MLSLKQEISNDLLIQAITENIARRARPEGGIFYRVWAAPVYPTRLEIQGIVFTGVKG